MQYQKTLIRYRMKVKKMIEYIYQTLENAFYYKLYYMQKELKLWLDIHHLIHLNNLITTGKKTM